MKNNEDIIRDSYEHTVSCNFLEHLEGIKHTYHD